MSSSVFQVVIQGQYLDIAPDYKLAMRRHLHIGFEDPKGGERARTVHASFASLYVGGYCDVGLYAIRYALSTLRPSRYVAEKCLLADPSVSPRVNIIAFDTEFDPTHQVLSSLFWVKEGISNVADERERLMAVWPLSLKIMRGQMMSNSGIVSELLGVQTRNGGLPFISDTNGDPEAILEAVGNHMVEWFDKLLVLQPGTVA